MGGMNCLGGGCSSASARGAWQCDPKLPGETASLQVAEARRTGWVISARKRKGGKLIGCAEWLLPLS